MAARHRCAGYAISQRIRKRVEEIFGWAKTTDNFRKSRCVGLAKTRLAGLIVATSYNLVRLDGRGWAAQANA